MLGYISIESVFFGDCSINIVTIFGGISVSEESMNLDEELTISKVKKTFTKKVWKTNA